MFIQVIGVGGGWAGALVLPVGEGVEILGKILHQNFGRFHIFWAILSTNIFRALGRNTVSI